VHVLVDGDTLMGIAYREYGDPAMWRVIAAANRVDDPLRLTPGRSLLLPAGEELVAEQPRAGGTTGSPLGTSRGLEAPRAW
jgi:hypothetical protein